MRASLIGFALGMVFSIITTMSAALTFVPGLINRWMPVVRLKLIGQPVEDDRRMVGFYYVADKLRKGRPRYYTFYVVNQLNQGIPVSAFKGNADCTKEIEPMLVDHDPLSPPWTNHYCFSLNGVIEPGQKYFVVGEAGHTAWPYISMVTTPLPSFAPVRESVLPPPPPKGQS